MFSKHVLEHLDLIQYMTPIKNTYMQYKNPEIKVQNPNQPGAQETSPVCHALLVPKLTPCEKVKGLL